MKTVDIVAINNALFNLDKSQVKNDTIKASLIWDFLQVSPIAEKFDKDCQLAAKQWALSETDSTAQKIVKQKNYNLTVERLKNVEVELNLEKFTIEDLNEATKDVAGFKFGYYAMLLPLFMKKDVDKKISENSKKK